MNVSLRWLKEMVPGLGGTIDELSEHLALRGMPVEGVESPGDALRDIVIGKVLEASQHPNADRLRVCEVDGGDGVVQVVCGAPNVKAGTYYPFAPVGSKLPGDFKIKKAKIRGEVSQGMLCSARELGLGVDHDGILELDGDFTPGASFVDALGLDDATLDVEITSNRGDLLSHAGVARELASEGDGRVEMVEIPGGGAVDAEYVEGSPEVSAGGVSVRIDDPDLCSRYLGAVIRGVKIGPSPAWLQERLRGAGARPINNVVDATNYVMLELGQPMHAFDLQRLAGQQIVVRRAGSGAGNESEVAEKGFTTLDDEARTLTGDMLMICDGERPVAIGGVMGGLNSEVDDDTTDLLLEAALFDPKSIRATRKALVMSTDASYRFERGVDPAGMRRAMERCIEVVLATAGGSLDGPVLDCGSSGFEEAVVDLRLPRIERLLGIPFDGDYVTSLLTPLGFSVEGRTADVLHVRVPGYRSYDVTREVDLIEEVARTHGFDHFPDTLGPERPGTVPDHPAFQLEDRLRDALAAAGLYEAHTPAFAPRGEGDVEVANPLATTEPVLRWAVLPALLRRVEYNQAHGNRDVRLFEIGTVFRRAGSGEAPHEASQLAAVLTGRAAPPHWSREDIPLEVWDLKALLEESARVAYPGGVTLDVAAAGPTDGRDGDGAPPHFDPAMTFVARDAGGTPIGHGGRIAPERIDLPAWGSDVWAFELALPAEPDPQPVPTYVPMPQFPASERDLALIVPRTLTAAEVTGHVERFGGKDLEDVELFDVYEGEGVPDGARSLAYRLRFRAPHRTLKDKDVDKAVRMVLKRLEEDLGVTARG